MKALIDYIKLLIARGKNWLIINSSWPVWYFFGMTVLLFLISVEILGTWAAWAYLMLGFGVWGYRRVK
jgi:hypothetical protein